MPGCRCSPASMRRSKNTPSCTRDACVLLVDTYNVLRHGVPDAIKVFDEVLKPMGKRPKGNPHRLRRHCVPVQKSPPHAGRSRLPGLPRLCASNSLDEYLVRDLILQGARVDSFGIGEKYDHGQERAGVRRRVQAGRRQGRGRQLYPHKMKLSESAEKTTIPCLKKVWRIYDEGRQGHGRSHHHGGTRALRPNTASRWFDPVETWKERTYVNCTGALPLHADLFPGRARLPVAEPGRYSANSAKRRSIRCGTKSSALKTRTAIMST